MTGAELAARVTAARAVAADFTAAADGFIDHGAAEPHWQDWAWRLSSELRNLTGELGDVLGDLEHDETERRWLRTRLLNALPSTAEVDWDTASYLASVPGDVCQVVTGWLRQRRPATGVSPDGSATLDHADLLTVRDALNDAAGFLEDRAGRWCDACAAAPDEMCDHHDDDLGLATRYRAAAIRLGDDR